MSAIRSAAWPSQSGGGSGGRRRRSAQCRRDRGDRRRVEAEQGVGAGADGHRALGVVAQGEAGDAEVGRLLLDAAGVGEDGAGVGHQREEVEVAERLGQQQARGARLERASIILRVRGWTGKTTGISRARRGELRDRLGQQRAVDEGRAVQGDEQVGAGLDAELRRRARRRGSGLPARPGCRSSCCRRSACARRRCPRRAGSRSPPRCGGRGSSEKRSATIRLTSSGIVRSKLRRPGLDVGDRDPHLHRGQRRRQGRVDVAGDDHQVGPLVERGPAPGAPSSAPSAAAWLPEPTSSMWSGAGTPELLEEDLRHQPVVVLAGVDDRVPALGQPRAAAPRSPAPS